MTKSYLHKYKCHLPYNDNKKSIIKKNFLQSKRLSPLGNSLRYLEIMILPGKTLSNISRIS